LPASGYRGPNEKRPGCVVLQGLSRIPRADGGWIWCLRRSTR